MTADPGLHTTLYPAAPYRLDLTAQALRRVTNNIVDVVSPDGTYVRALSSDDGIDFVSVRQTQGESLDVRITGPRAGARADTVVRMLGTDVDLDRWYRRVEAFPWLAALTEELRGMKPPRYPDLWEALCNGIVFQQLSIAAASTIMLRLVELLSEPLEHAGVPLRAFPGPDRLMRADDEELAAVGLSRQKVAYLRNAADAVTSRAIVAEHIESLPSEAASAELQKVAGIGRWSAANILLRGFGRLDVFPLGDSGAEQNIKTLSGDPGIRLDDILATLGDMRGMLYFHLLLGKLRGIRFAETTP